MRALDERKGKIYLLERVTAIRYGWVDARAAEGSVIVRSSHESLSSGDDKIRIW